MNSKEKGLQFYDLSQEFGDKVPLWPHSEDVKIERVNYHAKSRLLSQRITTVMHCTTHVDAPVHVLEGAPYLDELPLSSFFGKAVIVSIPKEKWEIITADDLEKAQPKIEKGDIVMVNTGWHKYYGDSQKYFCYFPGFYEEAGQWFVEKGVKAVGIDTPALDHPLGTAIGPHGRGPLQPWICDEYKDKTGHGVLEDFPLWEPCHRAILSNGIVGFENVGGEINEVTGKRLTIAAFPWRWVKGDGCIVRIVAIVDTTSNYRL